MIIQHTKTTHKQRNDGLTDARRLRQLALGVSRALGRALGRLLGRLHSIWTPPHDPDVGPDPKIQTPRAAGADWKVTGAAFPVNWA